MTNSSSRIPDRDHGQQPPPSGGASPDALDPDGEPLVVAALYKFAPLRDREQVQQHLLEHGTARGIRGTLLLADEGINGTISGPRSGIDHILSEIRSLPGFADIDVKESGATNQPFGRLRVRLKNEIVTIRDSRAAPHQVVGTYVDPDDWNAVISDPEVVLIDTRNGYEVEIGTFEGAIDPGTRSFGEFPDWVARNLDPARNRKVAMFCTGGIRCEKASSLMINMGFEHVFHLKGGILKYLEDVPEEDSRWRGECFVFDGRVALGHGLKPGSHAMCEDCNHPYPKHLNACPRCASKKRFGEKTTLPRRDR